MKWIVVVLLLIAASILCLGQRIPPPPQSFINSLNNPPPNQTVPGAPPGGPNVQLIQQQQQSKSDELANIKDENVKKILTELSTLQTPSQTSDTMQRVTDMIGPLFIADYDSRKSQISRDTPDFPERLISAVTDIQGEETKGLLLQKKLDMLHSSDFAFLPLAIQYGMQNQVLSNLSGTKLASVVKVNPGDTVIAYKIASALVGKPDEQLEFLQSVGFKLLPQVQRILMSRLLEWWGDPHTWKDRELNLLTSAGTPLLAYMPQSQLQSLDDELADRFVTTLGQTQDIARSWWRKPMSLKKAWFDVAKGARYFGAVHEWSFRRMQKLSFLLEGASPEDLELIPPVPEIKGLVIGNHYTELQARVVFDAFYNNPPLSQEDLQEFQFHVLDLIPVQLQRFSFADSFGTLDEMMSILDRQPDPSYPTILQISYYMWPIVNGTNAMTIAPPATWQKRELAEIGKLFFLLPKSVLMQIQQGIINWDSNTLSAIRSNHLTQFQIWKLTSQILATVDDRFKPDYIFMIPAPYQQGIPSHNITQALLSTATPRPELMRALIQQAPGMLISQQAVVLQRILNRIGESNVIRTMVSSRSPSALFKLISPKILSKNMGSIIKTIMEMPETGRFGITSIQTKLLPNDLLSLWLRWVRENGQVAKWTAEDLLGRSPLGATNELNYAIFGLTCRDIEIVDPWDILSVIMHYRHELYALRRFKPSLTFNVNLRPCVLGKFIDYLKQKQFINGNQTDGHILSGVNAGETEAVGGEILSIIPTPVLEQLDADSRLNIIKEIGQLQMQELFSLSSLENLHWYGKTLFRDLATSTSHGLNNSAQRRRRQSEGNAGTESTADPSPNAAGTEATATNSTSPTTAGSDTVRSANDTSATGALDPNVQGDPSIAGASLLRHGIDLEALNSMGNLMCYADNLFDANWPRSLLKDVLEAKTSIGEKTCCLPKAFRDKWFETLKAVYGTDTSSWNEFDITAVGDLLIVLPESDLQKISTDVLGKAVTPLMRQSSWATKISIPGGIKKIQFVTACAEALGTEGQEFMARYKFLMKRIFQASQWMVNTVMTTQELIRDGVGRTGRIPRWAEHTLVKRQIQLSMSGGQLAYGGTTAATTPTMVYQTASPTFGVQPQYVSYSPQFSPMVTTFNPQQSMFATTPTMYNVQPTGQVYMSQPVVMPTQPTFGTVPQVIGGAGAFAGTDSTAALAGTVAGPGGTAGIAGATAGGIDAGTGGGSFSAAGAATQAGGGNAGAAGFAQGGSFSQGSDLSPTGGGSFDQSNAAANTFAARSAGNNQQPGTAGTAPSQPPPPTQLQAQQPQQGQAVQQGAAPPVMTGAAQGQPPQPGTPPVQPQPGSPPGQTQPGSPPVQPQPISPPGQPQPTPTHQQPGQPQPSAGQPQPGGILSQPPPPGQPQQTPPGQPQQTPPGQPLPGMQPGSAPPPGTNIAIPPSSSGGASQQQSPTGASNPTAGGSFATGRSGSGSGATQDLRTRALNFGAFQDETHNSEITCHGVKASGPAAIGLTIDDLNKLSQQDLFDCVEALGVIEWDDDMKRQIMTLLKQKLEFNQDSINTLTLIELGDLVTAFSAKEGGSTPNTSVQSNATVHSDISMIDLTLPNSLDMLALLGAQITDPALLKSLAEKFNQDNKIFPGFSEGIARPENLRIVVMSLGNIICGLNNKIVNSIFETDASLFIDASRVLGKLEGCGSEVLTTLAAHAVRPSNYGPPRLWSQEDLETIGVVFAGLKPDLISTIPADSMQGLTALAVKNLPASSITAFTSDQLKKISYNAARAFTHVQSNNFSPTEAEAIKAVLQISPEMFNVPLTDATASAIPTPTTPSPSEPPASPPDDSLVLRDTGGDGEDASLEGLEGRAGGVRNRTAQVNPDQMPPGPAEPTEPTTTPPTTTTTPPPATAETPSSSASSSKVTSTWHVDYFVTLLAVITSVIQFLKI